MLSSPPILTILIVMPLIGAMILLALNVQGRQATRPGLWISFIIFLLSLSLFSYIEPGQSGYQLVENHQWFSNPDIGYRLGVDGISIFFILLTTTLTPLCILAGWVSIKKAERSHMVAFLVMESLLIGMFAARDLVLFYVFFEAVLIPMFIIIGVWGGKNRVYAAFKFFLFTLTGSILMLIAVIAMVSETNSASIGLLQNYRFSETFQIFAWLALFAAFAVKVPMWPFHTWLPDAHVEAPTAGSVMLAGVLLKLGGYGFIRFSLPMFPDASQLFQTPIYILSAIAVVYASLAALAQSDMKKLVAYSSIAHMGFVTAGIFSNNIHGLNGAMIQMLSHGVISAALFLVVGVIYERTNSREISTLGGLAKTMPDYSFLFMLFMLGSIGLPGTSGFVGELLVLIGVFASSPISALFLASGMVLGAAYMLYLYARAVFGKVKLSSLADLDRREFLMFTPLVIIMFWMGLYPTFFLQYIDPVTSFLIRDLPQIGTIVNP